MPCIITQRRSLRAIVIGLPVAIENPSMLNPTRNMRIATDSSGAEAPAWRDVTIAPEPQKSTVARKRAAVILTSFVAKW
ncbi:conserved hypothetical protein [Ricinus communis]|uniref:Uncharacterized protein n=1 Tax=Ricinus communis TaxID=3988 RepID=B9TKE6_RICCO|nr:conserved hypothetical protein [Ricinus communis]